jgi:hypothetical protein
MNIRYTKELLAPVVRESKSWADVCRAVGVKLSTGAQSHLTRRAKGFGLDSSHFTGMLWSKGKKLPPKRAIEDYLTVNSMQIGSDALRRRLIRGGLKEKRCETCGLSEWLGKELPLHLDHVNRDHFDNRIENLQILCPNCHAQKTREDRTIYAGMV